MITYRPAEPADADAVMAFWSTSAEDSGRPPDSSAALLRLIERDPLALTLAIENAPAATAGIVVSDGLLVGSIIAGWDGWRCHLYRLAVAPTHRRRGIGQHLVSLAEQRFESYGGTRADAMVLDDNTQAHPTWTSAGYIPQPDWSRWVKPL